MNTTNKTTQAGQTTPMRRGEKFTPGPWHIGHEQDYQVDRYAKNAEWARVRGADGRLIARVESVHPTGKRKSADFDIEAANARLISKSPDLYHTLQELETWASARENTMGDPCRLFECQNRIRIITDKARALLTEIVG